MLSYFEDMKAGGIHDFHMTSQNHITNNDVYSNRFINLGLVLVYEDNK